MPDQRVAAPSVGQLYDETNWDLTPLGPPAAWPPALRYAVSLCRNSGFPMLIWWGAEAIQVYNDAYIPLLGKRHPAAFAQRGADCWPEVWDVVGPLMERTRETGEPFSAEDMSFALERNGFVEEAY